MIDNQERIVLFKVLSLETLTVKLFLVRCEGLRTEGVVLSYWYSVQTVKSTETNVTFVILGYINKHWLIDWLIEVAGSKTKYMNAELHHTID